MEARSEKAQVCSALLARTKLIGSVPGKPVIPALIISQTACYRCTDACHRNREWYLWNDSVSIFFSFAETTVQIM